MLRDFITPGIQGIASSIARPNIEANNFELKPTLISMVQQPQFGGTHLEDPNCDILKSNGVSIDVIRLWLFAFSLRDKVRAWLRSLPSGYITT